MNNGKEITSADFEKAFEEMYKAGVDNNQAIVFLPNGSGFDVFKVDASVIKAAMYFNTLSEPEPKDPHEVSKVKCDLCSYTWVAVRPEGLTKIECPHCGNMVNFENIPLD